MTDAHEDEYDDALVTMLELIWGEGFLSPGGPAAARRIVEGLDLKEKDVLDIGCGIGGADVVLAKDFGCRIVGIDIEGPLIERARGAAAGNAERIDFQHSPEGRARTTPLVEDGSSSAQQAEQSYGGV